MIIECDWMMVYGWDEKGYEPFKLQTEIIFKKQTVDIKTNIKLFLADESSKQNG